MTDANATDRNSNMRHLRRHLLLSACFAVLPGVAFAQAPQTTNIDTATTTTLSIDEDDVINVGPGGSIIVTGARAITFNGQPTGNGPVINNRGRIESNNASGYGIETQNPTTPPTTITRRQITINNLSADSVIRGTEGGIRIRNGAGSDTSITDIVAINNAGLILGGTIVNNAPVANASAGGGIVTAGIPNADLRVVNSGTILGVAGIITGQATITSTGLIAGAGTGPINQGTAYLTSNGEAIRINGRSDGTGTNLITLGAGSRTDRTGNAGNAIFIRDAASSTITIRDQASVTGDIQIAAGNSTIDLDAGSTVTGSVRITGGIGTVNLQTGATVTGAISAARTTANVSDTLNLLGPGSATLGQVTAFQRVNVLSGDWTLVRQTFASALGASIAQGATVRYNDGVVDENGALVGNIENNGALIYNRTNTLATSSAISGTGTLTIANTGTLGLSSAATYSGATSITAGSLRGDAANVFSAGSAVTIGADGTLATNDTAQTVANVSGAGRITTGTVTGGVLTTGAGSGDTTYAGVVSGLGGITKVGSGTLTLAGANTATGVFTAAGGTLLVTGSVNGSANAQAGATLAGNGSIAGPVSVANGATLAPGANGVGTITTGNLTLAPNAILAFDLGAPGVPGASDRIQVNGDLVLDGTLNATDAGGFGIGVYRLIDYTGMLTDNGLAIGAFPAGTNPGLLAVQTAIGGQVNLVYGGAAADPIQFWDGTGPAGDGQIQGGSGSWTNAGTNWTDANGTGIVAWNGNFAVFQGAVGTVTVNDAITLTGMQFVTSDYTVADGTGSLTINDAQANFRVDPGAIATIATGIGGSGGIVKNDAGTLTLAAANTYAGSTTIAGGIVRTTVAGALPTTALTVATGATLDVAASQTVGSLAGAGAITLSGGSLTAGALGTNTSFSGTITGGGGFTKVGTGTLSLTGTNAWTGATSIADGTVNVTGNGRIGSGALDVSNGGLLNLNGIATSVGALSGDGRVTIGTDGRLTTTSAASTTFSGTLTGTRAELVKTGSGTLTLSGNANTFSGGTTINDGVVFVTNAGALSNTGGLTIGAAGTFRIDADKTVGALTGSGAIQLGANRLTTGSAQNVTFAGVMSGTGGFTKAGTGTLTLSGTNTYTGETALSGGTLLLTGAVAGAASVSGGGTLGGTGSIAGVLTVADGTIAPGANGVGTLTLGGLVLGANSILAYDLGAPGNPAASDRIQVNGNLTLAGTLNAADAGGFGQGVYRLIDYSGALTDNGLIVGTLPAGFVAGQTEVQTSVGGQVNLVVGASLPEIQFWDGTNMAANGQIDGGSGSWGAATRNWTNAAGTSNTPWGGRFAVFQGAGGTVTVDSAIGFTGMQFVTSGYTIAAGAGTLSADAATSAIRVDPGATATIAAAIGGNGGLQKLDTGTLILTGANSYAGATTVSGGTLRVGAGALPGTTAVTVAGGATLDLTTAQTIANLAGAGSVTLSGGGLTTGDANSTTFTGVISGSGGLTKTGSGTFTLSGANSYAGGTIVSAGTLRLADAGRLGTGALAVASGATLDLNGVSTAVGTLGGAGAITLGTATLSAGAGADSTFTGVISGGGALTKTGTGNLTLSGASSYTGTTRVAAGTLTLANATAIPTVAAVVVDQGATLALGSAKTIASLDGAGSIALGANTMTISSGAFAGAIGGTGALTKTGAGTLTLTGANSYTGATTVSGGTLALGQGGSIASSSVALTASGAALAVAGTQAIGTLTGVAGSTVQLAGALTQTNTAAVTLASTLSGTGSFTKAGTGTYTLAVANTHSGGTGGTAGILRAGAAGAFGSGVLTVGTAGRAELNNFAQTVAGLSGAGTIVLGTATLTVGDANASSYDGVISGTGGLTKVGAGAQILAGTNTYTGATVVNAGALVVNGSLASTVTVATGARLGGSGTVAGLVVNGTLAPGNSIGTMTVNGNLTLATGSVYQVEVDAAGAGDRTNATGTVTINGGTVQVLATPGTYGAQTDYTILTGAGGLSGQFAAVTSDTAFLAPSLLYNANAVTLRLQRNNVSFASVAQTENQLAVAAALGRTQSGALFNTIVTLNAASARAGFDALSGEVHATALTAANREAQAGQRPLLDRLAAGTGDGASLWLQGTGSRFDVDGRDGFAGVEIGRIGLLGGFEYGAGAARFGIAGGYAISDLNMDARASDAKIKTARVAVYGGIASGGLRLRAGAGYQHHSVTTDRTVFVGALSDTPAASYAGSSVQAFGEAGYSFGGAAIAVEPFAGIAWARTTFDAATETGGVAALRLGDDRVGSSVATLGVRLGTNRSGEGVRLDGLLAARRFLSEGQGSRDAAFVGTGQGFTVSSADFGRTGGIARLGFSVPALGGRLGAGVEGDFAKDARDYGARVTAGWRF